MRQNKQTNKAETSWSSQVILEAQNHQIISRLWRSFFKETLFLQLSKWGYSWKLVEAVF